MMNYINEEMQKALVALKSNDTPQNRSLVVELLFTTSLYIPATWDKNPVRDENGKMAFPADTHFSLLTIQTTDHKRFFPAFTSKEESEKWQGSKKGKMLMLNYDQYIPIVEMAKEDISGIVIDPYGANVPLQTPFLLELKNHPRHTGLKETKIQKGEKVSLRNPVMNVEDLKQALIQYGKEHPNIHSITLKERVVPDQPSHWFLIVEMDPEDPHFLQDMAHACAHCSHGKQFEFIFGSMRLAKEILEKNSPLYIKTDA